MFSAAHFLREYSGNCENVHGHNFEVEVIVQGDTLQEGSEILMDFKEIKKGLHNIIARLDHTLLNDHPYFKTRNPSSENIARFIFWEFRRILEGSLVNIVSVSVSETSGKKATYREEICDWSFNG